MDHPVPLLKEPAMRAANRVENERQRKAKEDKKKE
jgi:hypothetical protein